MVSDSDDLSAEDRGLLEQAAKYLKYGSLEQLTAENLRSISTEKGIDFATALLYQRVLASAEHGPAIEILKQSSNRSSFPTRLPEITLAVAPGAFYLEYPETGAEGQMIRQAAQSLGCQEQLIPTASVGTLKDNAETIVSWLLQNRGKRIILASLSKGSADIIVALRHKQAAEAFQGVIAWINVGGITSGSPIATWVLSRKIPSLAARILFWWRKRNFQFLTDLDRRVGNALDSSIRIPEHMTMIHVVGFPLECHLTTKHSRIWHRRLAEYGPNDGATMLIDSCKLPGIVFPVWGADHYAAGQVDWGGLTRNLLRFLESEPDRVELSQVSPEAGEKQST